MPSQWGRTSFITYPARCIRSQAPAEVDNSPPVSGPTWRSSRPRHLRVLCKNDAELTGGSAPINFYMFEKVSARAHPAPAAHHVPRSPHLTRAVPFVQLSAASGSLKLRNPMAHTRQSWAHACVGVVLVVFPPVPVAVRAGVG